MFAPQQKGALAGAPENLDGICSTFLVRVSSIVWKHWALVSGFVVLTACGPSERGDSAWRGEVPKSGADPATEAGYLKPPSLTSSRQAVDGRVELEGNAEPGTEVWLGAPGGATMTGTAGPDGVWSIRIPSSGRVQLFGLSMNAEGDRRIQAQGYLAVLPDGRSAQLRSGASAQVIGPASTAPRLLSVDFDRDGAASVAGVALPESGVSLRVDRSAAGAGKTDRQGRFHLAIERPLAPGDRRFEIAGERGEQTSVLSISPAAPLGQPFRAARIGGHWRIDWMTPGGGVQSTLILGDAS